MSRIVILTYGSLGDLHPAFALAHGLQARGHDVAIATSAPYREKTRAAGIEFLPVRPDLSLSDDVLVRRIMDGTDGSRLLMQELVFPNIRAMHADLLPIAQRSNLLVSSELACAAPIVAAQTGIPWAFFALSPVSFFTVFNPPLLPGPRGLQFVQSLGPTANRWVRAMAKLVSHGWWSPVRALRRELGLPAGHSPLFEGKYSPRLNLALFSPVLQEPQRDWPAPTVQTGFLFHDENHTTPALPPAVDDFLQRGPPPIVFTLGSAAVSLAGNFYHESAAAARQLDRRALLLLGRNSPPPDLPGSVLAWDYLPYTQIFPRAAAIVHQGGVGTTGQALRAGRPMLVMPFAHDQFDNAERVHRLGVGRTIARNRYTADNAARELGALLADPRASEAATRLGATVRAEAGIDRACDALERLLVTSHRRWASAAPWRSGDPTSD